MLVDILGFDRADRLRCIRSFDTRGPGASSTTPNMGFSPTPSARCFPPPRDTVWLGPTTAMAVVVSADAWHWSPYMALGIRGGLISIPAETEETTLGAGPSTPSIPSSTSTTCSVRPRGVGEEVGPAEVARFQHQAEARVPRTQHGQQGHAGCGLGAERESWHPSRSTTAPDVSPPATMRRDREPAVSTSASPARADSSRSDKAAAPNRRCSAATSAGGGSSPAGGSARQALPRPGGRLPRVSVRHQRLDVEPQHRDAAGLGAVDLLQRRGRAASHQHQGAGASRRRVPPCDRGRRCGGVRHARASPSPSRRRRSTAATSGRRGPARRGAGRARRR